LDADKICRALNEFQIRCNSFDRLLEEAVKIIHESNDGFHWTGIYERLPQKVLRLGPYVGAPTDHVLIPVGQGVCGSAVAEERNKVVPDVTKEANYIACSLSTKSEMVILIQKGGRIFGQIDIDSHNLDAFDGAIVQGMQKVADWLAGVYEARVPQMRN